MNLPGLQAGSDQLPILLVSVGHSAADRRDFRLATPFRIGRGEDCDVRIQDEHVSRHHAAVTFANGQWWIQDLNSSNGILLSGERIQVAPIGERLIVRLGIEGPFVQLQLEPLPPPPPIVPVTKSAEHYFGKAVSDDQVGDHTRMIRMAFQQIQAKQRWKFGKILMLLVIALLSVAGFALYQYRQAREHRAMAKEIFYAMKSLDLDIANLEKLVLESNSQQGLEQVRKYRSRRKDMEDNYDRFLSNLRIYDPKLTEQDRLVLRVARVFGECELAMPAGFKEEVQNYIKKWQSSGRLARAIATAQKKGYTRKITDELLTRNLPPQLFYLALQESDFDAYISGPPTYKGIAKGMWQFIPETAVKYGLRIGPLADFRRPDPADERHQWEKATRAAAAYLTDIYTTDAQASGLLVIASYNWGEDKVIRLIRSMPANPRDRNFWRLLSDHRDKIPEETYNYVFYMVSAAVIGENPRLFGFNFENPLAHLESK